jgi:hypothetical protein
MIKAQMALMITDKGSKAAVASSKVERLFTDMMFLQRKILWVGSQRPFLPVLRF